VEIKVLTYNAYLLYPDYQGLLRATKLRRILEKGTWDIVGLCEVYHSSLRKILLDNETLRKNYPYMIYAKKTINHIDNGLVLLSKHKIKLEKYYQYHSYHNIWYNRILPPKDLVFAVVEIQNKECGVFLTHLQWGDSQELRQVRKEHVLELKKYIQTNWNQKRPYVILGDLNLNGSLKDPEYQFLREQFENTYDWWFDTHDTEIEPGYTWDPANTKLISPLRHERLDFILSSNMIKPIKTRLHKFNSKSVEKVSIPKDALTTKEWIWYNFIKAARIIHGPMYVMLAVLFSVNRLMKGYPVSTYYSNNDLSDHYAIEGRGKFQPSIESK
jgi:endonuclease/exonuclease/phosphatase family metal-dependent hydrolase